MQIQKNLYNCKKGVKQFQLLYIMNYTKISIVFQTTFCHHLGCAFSIRGPVFTKKYDTSNQAGLLQVFFVSQLASPGLSISLFGKNKIAAHDFATLTKHDRHSMVFRLNVKCANLFCYPNQLDICLLCVLQESCKHMKTFNKFEAKYIQRHEHPIQAKL
jgi:hypothetical protein